jgi:hypothetical protein
MTTKEALLSHSVANVPRHLVQIVDRGCVALSQGKEGMLLSLVLIISAIS